MILLFALGCVHEVSRELELIPSSPATAEPEPEEVGAWRAWVVHGDPLARHPRLPATARDTAFAPWLAVATANPAEAVAWWRAEQLAAGTAAVPLFRGARLAAIEAVAPDPAGVLPWLVPLAVNPTPVDHPRGPLEWLSAAPDALLTVAERATLLGWLDGPAIDVRPAAALLELPVWARLAEKPAGALVRARVGTAAPSPAAHADVDAALALLLADASRDPATPTLRAAALARLGVAEGAPDAPRDAAAALLRRALPGLTAAAHVDEDAGLALAAHAALRLRGACEDLPCGGFDRLPELAAAARFGPGPARVAALLRVLAWEAAVSELHAAWDRPQVTHGMDRVVELLAADDPRALDRSFLTRPAPDPGWVLPVTRALGGPEGTSKEAALRVLWAHVAEVAHGAVSQAPDAGNALTRIEKRARLSAP